MPRGMWDVLVVGGLAQPQDRADIRMIQRGRRSGLLLEPFHAGGGRP